jgi:hypothetical protein
MNLLNPIKCFLVLIADCKDAGVSPKACANLLINNMGDTPLTDTLAHCMIAESDLHNGYNPDYGRYCKRVSKQVYDRFQKSVRS